MIAKNKSRRIEVAILGVVALFAATACSGTGSSYSVRPSTSRQSASSFESSKAKLALQKDLEWRPTQKNSIPVSVNPAVQKWINTFQGGLKGHFDLWVTRIGKYGTTIDKILDEEGVPRDLIYLAMIESGFNMSAKSQAAANGPWQFISSTGKMYGLKNDFFVDDRHDLEQATRAAARHLKDLHTVYGDWYLAFAAYNAGPGKVNQAIKRSGTRDYWRLAAPRSRYLRQETKDYVPKILAALTIVKNYQRYGYNNASFGKPVEFDRVSVPDATDVSVIAACAGVKTEEIQTLNPGLLKGITPPGQKFEVIVPKGRKEIFERSYALLPADKRVSMLQYRAGKGESVASVAKKYKVSPSQLASANGISSSSRLSSGQKLVIPATRNTLIAMASVAESKQSGGTKKINYRVRPRDTIAKVAAKYGVSDTKLAKWNKLKKNSRLRVGQSLLVYQNQSNAGSIMTGELPSGRSSGVASIILKEQQNPVPVEVAMVPKAAAAEKFPTLIASAQTFETAEMSNAEQPAIVKNIDGTISLDKTVPAEVAGELMPDTTPFNSTAPSESSVKVATNSTAKSHKVKANESLGLIANRYGISVSTLKSLNGLKSNYIKVGQVLKIKSAQQTATVASALKKTNAKNQLLHKVKNGETLWSVSKKYGVSVAEIKKWNGLSKNVLVPNQRLKIANRARM